MKFPEVVDWRRTTVGVPGAGAVNVIVALPLPVVAGEAEGAGGAGGVAGHRVVGGGHAGIAHGGARLMVQPAVPTATTTRSQGRPRTAVHLVGRARRRAAMGVSARLVEVGPGLVVSGDG